MITAKVGRRGQITIPKEVREALQIEEGQRIAFVRRGGYVTLEPLTTTIFDLRGAVSVEGEQDFDTIREEVRRQKGSERTQSGPSMSSVSEESDGR